MRFASEPWALMAFFAFWTSLGTWLALADEIEEEDDDDDR